jgi:hypothetical protein
MGGMSSAPRGSWLGYELRLLGGWPFALLAGVAGLLAGMTALLSARGVSRSFLAGLLVATLEACVPLALAVTLTSVTGRDEALELQLSLATPYWVTVARRVGLLLLWAFIVELVTMLVVQIFFTWAAPKHGYQFVTAWAAPLLWLAAAGTLLPLLLRGRAAAGATLGVIWLAQQALHGTFATTGWLRPWFLFATLYAPTAPYWWTNRLELLLTALVGFAAAWLLLRRPGWRVRVEED